MTNLISFVDTKFVLHYFRVMNVPYLHKKPFNLVCIQI